MLKYILFDKESYILVPLYIIYNETIKVFYNLNLISTNFINLSTIAISVYPIKKINSVPRLSIMFFDLYREMS
jgi:hypothetical protein